MPARIFFPSGSVGVQVARLICAGCSVRTTCLEYALEHRIAEGVWGGCSERERVRIRRQRRRDELGATGAPGERA